MGESWVTRSVMGEEIETTRSVKRRREFNLEDGGGRLQVSGLSSLSLSLSLSLCLGWLKWV